MNGLGLSIHSETVEYVTCHINRHNKTLVCVDPNYIYDFPSFFYIIIIEMKLTR